MTYFKELTNLPILDLSSEFDKLMNQGIIDWYRDSRDQICLNSIKGHEDDIHLGRGSLVYDWDNYTRDENGALVVPERKIRLLRKRFQCTVYKV